MSTTKSRWSRWSIKLRKLISIISQCLFCHIKTPIFLCYSRYLFSYDYGLLVFCAILSGKNISF